MSRSQRATIRSTLSLMVFASLCGAAPIELFVAPDGNDAWTGGRPSPSPRGDDGPFASLERARDALRRLKASGARPEGATVWLRGGTYKLAKPLALSAEDSGTQAARIVYRAYESEHVILTGGHTVRGFSPVTEPAVLARLDAPARGNVLQTDLAPADVPDFGEVASAGNRLELFYNDQPMTLARWPNEGFIRIAKVTGGQPFKVHGITGDRVGRFTYEGNRPRRWQTEDDLWLHGYWFWDWSDAFQKVIKVDPVAREITLASPFHNYGYRKGQRFYAINVLAELDTPGEWYLDRARRVLYFWPPSPIDNGRAVVSVLDHLLVLENVSWVTFRGITFEATRSAAVMVNEGRHNELVGCTLRNTGGWGARLSGTGHAVIGCDIYRTAAGGIALRGGDRNTLTPGALTVLNSHIHDFGRVYRTYRPAVQVQGVGQRVAHNRIHDGPHNAIQLSGNDHTIEFNEIYDVCYETGDVGAFYMGRDWTERGTIIRHNFFHHIQGPGLHGAMAVYLDDAASGVQVLGNVFYRAGRAAFIGGGRDNHVENNIFVECAPAVHMDARGLGWMRYHVEGDGTLPTRLKQVPYRSPPWSLRYPRLLDLPGDNPGAPTGNVIARNVNHGGRWSAIEDAARQGVLLKDNLLDEDPRFVDADNMNFQLRDDSPAYKLGFVRIPFDRIGLFADPHRASWPVPKTRRDASRPSK